MWHYTYKMVAIYILSMFQHHSKPSFYAFLVDKNFHTDTIRNTTMKNDLFISSPIVTFLSISTCFAQLPIDFGFKAGLSIPNLTARNNKNPINSGYSSRFGPDVALHIEFHFSKHFSLQPQLEFSSQGGKKTGFRHFQFY